MTEDLPLVSILIPTYNRVARLERAIESAIGQDYCRIEIVVSDNASEDGTDIYLASISSSCEIALHRQTTNIGLIGNWNFLASRARGSYCLMLSDDDELEVDGISTLVAALQRAERHSLSSEIVAIIGSSSVSKPIPSDCQLLTCQELMQRILLSEFTALPSATLFRVDSLRRFGYRNYYPTAIDMGLLADFIKIDGWAVIEGRVVCKYNIHADNVTAKFAVDDIYKTYRRILRSAYSNRGIAVDYSGPLNRYMRLTLGYVIAERYSSRKLSFISALVYLRKYRKYFKWSDYLSVPFKMLAKKIYCVFG
ncbi:glycosyltransferase family 2 protein [Roseateles sp.]|uniref:glycosyltransferase family 2 protein n=1 Tax=Roseateles sp. TaxID=1971397 RepID=UPI003264D1A2